MLVTHNVTGAIDVMEILHKISGLFDSGEFQGNYKILCDIRHGTIRKLSKEDLLEIVSATEAYRHKRGTERSAVLVSEDIDFGLMRMFEAMLLESDRPIRIFRERDRAVEWLELPHDYSGDDVEHSGQP